MRALVCRLMLVCIFFFFKQKTAYEMRISDWSSDVCSSDLAGGLRAVRDDEGDLGGKARLRAGPDQRLQVGAAARNEDPQLHRRHLSEIGRASCRERVCQYV